MNALEICSALEVLVLKRRGYGGTTKNSIFTRPKLPLIVGLVRIATKKAAHPSDLSKSDAQDRSDANYAYIDEGPMPRVVVMQDFDCNGGYGGFWYEVNSDVHPGLGDVGSGTEGSLLHWPDIATVIQMLVASVLPSYAGIHIADYARSIDVA